ncbi:AEC family transporter [Rhodobacterales bacterium HKCCE3408]|nr:AEC family transporter [Rhodobacterales bacterium HKCCE3408]
MGDVLAVILPVFLVIGAGFVAVWRGLFSDEAVEGLNVFTQKFAIPCLLFSAIATLDLGEDFDARLLLSYYTGSTISFTAGLVGGRYLVRRPWTDAVAIGFACLFANSVLLGLAVTERAYGADALAPNYAIVSIHAAFCYAIGIVAMEIARAGRSGPVTLARNVGRAILGNALMIGIGLGFAVNLSGLPIPGIVDDALSLMIRAALPAALFGLGGVLYRYRPEGDAATIALICVVSLLLHPVIVFAMGSLVTGLTAGQLRSAVITASMAPGVNSYLFANMYGAARRAVASSVLIGTALSILTASAWIALLP